MDRTEEKRNETAKDECISWSLAMKTDELSEKRERRKDDSKMAGGDGWREAERATSRASTTPGATAPPLHHGLGRSIARRLTEERWRKRGEEERTTEGQGDRWGSN